MRESYLHSVCVCKRFQRERTEGEREGEKEIGCKISNHEFARKRKERNIKRKYLTNRGLGGGICLKNQNRSKY